MCFLSLNTAADTTHTAQPCFHCGHGGAPTQLCAWLATSGQICPQSRAINTGAGGRVSPGPVIVQCIVSIYSVFKNGDSLIFSCNKTGKMYKEGKFPEQTGDYAGCTWCVSFQTGPHIPHRQQINDRCIDR